MDIFAGIGVLNVGHVGTFRGMSHHGRRTPCDRVHRSADLLSHARSLGTSIRGRFNELATNVSEIVDVRGTGLFVGVEFGIDDSKELVEEIQRRRYEAGVLVWSAGRNGHVLWLIPLLVLAERQADAGTDVIYQAIRSATY